MRGFDSFSHPGSSERAYDQVYSAFERWDQEIRLANGQRILVDYWQRRNDATITTSVNYAL